MHGNLTSTRLPQKTVALFGGSFNPPHEGHVRMATRIQQELGVDETWLLFSVSPDKDPAAYASLEHRMNMADILVRHDNAPVRVSDMEETIAREKGRHDTYYILQGLQERHPDTKFVWVMGADCFASFHNWKERDDILSEHVVAVVARPGYTQAALDSPTARAFATQKIDLTQPDAVRRATHGWCYLPGPAMTASSSGLLQELRGGRTDFPQPFAKVADYIHTHGLYGTRANSPLPAGPALPVPFTPLI